jgi:hypothetical protein
VLLKILSTVKNAVFWTVNAVYFGYNRPSELHGLAVQKATFIINPAVRTSNPKLKLVPVLNYLSTKPRRRTGEWRYRSKYS